MSWQSRNFLIFRRRRSRSQIQEVRTMVTRILLKKKMETKHIIFCWLDLTWVRTQCLKITDKVSFNIASEGSYGYILSGQKLIENAKKLSILASFWKPEACGQTVLPDMSFLKGQKLVGNAQIQQNQMRHFGWFSNDVKYGDIGVIVEIGRFITYFYEPFLVCTSLQV